MKEKTYIGDGVYAAIDGYHIVLTTENGINTTNTIYLEPDVIRALNIYTDSYLRYEIVLNNSLTKERIVVATVKAEGDARIMMEALRKAAVNSMQITYSINRM